ncbi:MAG: putative lipid II flippase FtsW [Chloroflexota bacterium]
MQRNVRKAASLVGVDPWLMLALLGLMCAGALMVYSSSIADAYTYYGSAYYVAQREVVWVVLGFLALGLVARIDYRRWQGFSLPFAGLSVFALVLVLAPHVGHSSHGAQRWFSLGAGVTIEPSELVKLALVLHMAAWFSSKGELVRDFKACFVPFSLVVGLVALLIVKQPDLGTAIVVSATMIAIYFIAGANLSHLFLTGTGAACIAWGLAHSSSYRYDRLTAFMDPWKDPSGVGYHTVQALLALGSGGLFGTGLGNSVQKYVLPAPHTDSILAVIGEEWGVVGTVSILLLFVVIAYRGIRISITAPDNFGRLLAAGITSWVTFQALMNFAVITSSVPFTGVPLPFVSYGGTSLIITMTAMGILLNISRHASKDGVARFNSDYGRGNRRARLSGAVDHRDHPTLPEPVSPRPVRHRAKPAAGRRKPAIGLGARNGLPRRIPHSSSS